MRSTFTFNGHGSDEYDIYIENRHNLSRSARKFQTASVNGRNGNIYQLQNAWEEVYVSYDIYAGGADKGDDEEAFTDIMEWLNSADGYAKLSDSYDTGHYRLAVFVDATDIESQWLALGRATITFRCRPERFIVTSPLTPTSGSTIVNATKHIAKPIITLTGSGARSLFRIPLKNIGTGTAMSPNLAFLISAWNNDYVFWIKKYNNSNTAIQWTSSISATLNILDNSNGSIKYTTADVSWGLGWICPVSASTDYVLTLTAEQAGKVVVWMADESGYNQITKSVELSLIANTSGTIKFTTPVNCGYILVGLFSSSATSPVFKSIMLTTGTEVKPFNPYSSSSASNLTINDVVLKFENSGFDTAEIDCERENFILDGVNANNIVSVLDTYGNLSFEYLRLAIGTNTVTYSNDITAVSIDPRFWEL